MNKALLSFVCFFFFFCMSVPAFALPELSWPQNPSVIELSARPWLYELSKKYGRTIKALSDVPLDEFLYYKKRGIDVVWLMGVWKVGAAGLNHDRTDPSLLAGFKKLLPDFTLDDVIGSPYAVVEYTCNPELCPNGDSDLVTLRKKLHDNGLFLMLDFVPNHSALDSPWISDIGLYVRAPKNSGPPYDKSKYTSDGIAYGNCPYSSPWTDVAQLNYWNPALRKHMKTQLLHVSSLADAVRCDMAYIVLNDPFGSTWKTELDSWGWTKPDTEFWADPISEAKKQYGTKFLAETYSDYFWLLQKQGFDWTYDKELLDRFKSGNLDNIRGWLDYTKSVRSHMCSFIENHDEDRGVATIGSVEKADSAANIAYTIPGLRFYFQDQEHGFKNKLDVHLRRAASEKSSHEAEVFYSNLTSILKEDVFRNGNFANVQINGDEAWHFMGWKWTSGSTKRLVVINDSAEKAYAQVIVPDVSGSGNVVIEELFSKIKYTRSAPEMRSSGLGVVVNAYSAQIFSYP